MGKKDCIFIEDLLYSENISATKKIIKNMNNSLFIHIFAANYNWDNGFEIPNTIINNRKCDLGTALMIFYNADGLRFLESYNDFSISVSDKWMEFVSYLYNKIQNDNFKIQSISYTPQISKVQIFKLKKNNPNIPSIFLKSSPGIEVDIPVFYMNRDGNFKI